MNLHFQLGKTRKTGRTPIRCQIIIRSKPIYFNTPYEVESPDEFDSTTERFKNDAEKNRGLTIIEGDVYRIYDQKRHDSPSAADVKRLYLGTQQQDFPLSKLVEQFLKAKQKDPDKSKNTLLMYETRLKHFTAFLQANNLLNMGLYQVKVELIRKFDVYLQEYRTNDVKRRPLRSRRPIHIAARAMFNYAVSQELIEESPYHRFNMPKPAPYRPKDDLTLHELHALYQADAEKLGEYLHITREMFLFSVCLGGLAISDLLNIDPNEHIKHLGGRLWLKRARTKSEVPLYTPFNHLATEIYERRLEQYGATIKATNRLYHLNISSYNRYLAELMGLLGIDKKITTHCSRATVATNMELLGIRENIVESLLGHAPKNMIGRHYKRIPDKVKINAVDALAQGILEPSGYD